VYESYEGGIREGALRRPSYSFAMMMMKDARRGRLAFAWTDEQTQRNVTSAFTKE